MLHELGKGPRSSSRGPRRGGRIGPLRRTGAMDRLLLDHLDVLEAMGPDGLPRVRDPLPPASGFQSEQFHAIEADEAAPVRRVAGRAPDCRTITGRGWRGARRALSR